MKSSQLPPDAPKCGAHDFTVKTLRDATTMIRNEINYVRTGKHVSVPMRDCRGQWIALLRDLEILLMDETE